MPFMGMYFVGSSIAIYNDRFDNTVPLGTYGI